MQLEGFRERVARSGEATDTNCGLEAAHAEAAFLHEPDWCHLACVQILQRQFGVIRL